MLVSSQINRAGVDVEISISDSSLWKCDYERPPLFTHRATDAIVVSMEMVIGTRTSTDTSSELLGIVVLLRRRTALSV